MHHIEQEQRKKGENHFAADVSQKADQPKEEHIGIKAENPLWFHRLLSLLTLEEVI